MPRGAALAIAMVFLLTASVFLVMPLAVRAAPVHPSLAHPAATDTIQTTQSNGGFRSDFRTGLSTGLVYFYAVDSVDTSATVNINDLNASRDGLTNPVATITAHFTAGINWSYQSNTRFALPLNLLYPGTWNITISGTTAGFAFQNFTVQTYYVDAFGNQTVILPGHSATVTYWVLSTINSAPYNHNAAVVVTGSYLTTGFVTKKLPGTPQSLGTSWNGSFAMTMPTDASATGFASLTFWANTSGTSVWSAQGSVDVYTGHLSFAMTSLSTCASGCFASTFQSGQPIIATVTEWINSTTWTYIRTPAVGIDLNILYEKGATPVTPAGSPPTKLVTNANGQAQWIFTADPNAFSTTGPNVLSVTPTDPSIPTNTMNGTSTTFYVTRSTAAMPTIQVVFNSAQYYGGDTIFANWSLTGNSSVTQGWNATLEWAYAYSSVGGYSWYIAQGTASGTSGAIHLVAPIGLNGHVEVVVVASNATGLIEGFGLAPVSQPQIFLSSNEPYYQAGDTVTVTITTLGSVLSSATLQSLVTDSTGARLISGPVTGTTLTVQIPMKGAPSYVEFSVFAIATTGATITNGTLYVDLATGFDVAAGIGTKSNYQDGSYQPSQTIQVTYAITARGGTAMPKEWTIWVWSSGAYENSGLGAVEIQTTAASGSIAYTIPGNSPNGIQLFYVEAIPSSSGGSATNSVAVNVQSSPSGLGLELGAGSGLTVGWLILLIVVIVIAIVLFLAIRSKGRPKMMKPDSGSPPSGSAPPQAWQEASPPSSTGTPPESPPPSNP
jgi:hypothetical protein